MVSGRVFGGVRYIFINFYRFRYSVTRLQFYTLRLGRAYAGSDITMAPAEQNVIKGGSSTGST